MPRLMQTTGRSVVLAALVALLLAACTGGDDGSTLTGASGLTGGGISGPAPAETLTPGVGAFTYESRGLVVTVDVEGSEGTIEVDNQGDHDLGAPGLYALDAEDGHQVPVEVREGEPVKIGETARFDVSLGDVDVDQVGLLVLLFGTDNYGAFVRTG